MTKCILYSVYYPIKACTDLVHVQKEVLVLGEEQVEVLEGLGEDKAVHPVLVLQGPDILDGRIAAGHPGVLLESAQHLLTDLEVVGVLEGGNLERIRQVRFTME